MSDLSRVLGLLTDEQQRELSRLDVRVRFKDEVWRWRTLLWFIAMRPTTVRLPFARSTIWLPADARTKWGMGWCRSQIGHELFHCRQFAPWWGPWVVALLYFVLPLPLGISGRWFVERRPFAWEVRQGVRTHDNVVGLLSGWSYFYAWPRSWVTRALERYTRDGIPPGRF